MTISNRREPSFDGAHSPSHSPAHSAASPVHGAAPSAPHLGAGEAAAHQAARASGLSRVVSTTQIVGSLLAVPLGLASGYSMYRANFSPETTCQTLRGNIIAMLDKSVDASTRRMLVRRDIAAFEESCGAVDPDAHAAFKALLALPPAPVTATAAAPKLRAALPATEVARKAEPKIETKVEAKVEPKAEPKAEPKLEAKAKVEPKSEQRQAAAEKQPAAAPVAEATQREAGMSDARWLAAVRQAMVAHGPGAADDEPAQAETNKLEPKPELKPEPKAEAKVEPRLDQVLPKPTAVTARGETIGVAKPASPAVAAVQLQPTWIVPGQTATAPSDASVAAIPVRDDHPVPPASIPIAAPGNGEAKGSGQSRIGSWIAEIPLVGRVIEPRGN